MKEEESEKMENKVEVYSDKVLKECEEEIKRLADEYNVRKVDVIYAAWIIARHQVFAKIKREKNEVINNKK